MSKQWQRLRAWDARPLTRVCLAAFGLVLFGCMGLEFSPDGKRIAFFIDRSNQGKESIAVINTDGTGFHYVPGSESSAFPHWSPDSRGIGYGSKAGALLYDLEARKVHRLASGQCELVLFSPDGSRVVCWQGMDTRTASLAWFDARSGVPRGVTDINRQRASPWGMGFVPGTNSIVYLVEESEGQDLFLATETGTRRLTTTGDICAWGFGDAPGKVVWVRGPSGFLRNGRSDPSDYWPLGKGRLPVYSMDVRARAVARRAVVELTSLLKGKLVLGQFGPGLRLPLMSVVDGESVCYVWQGVGTPRKVASLGRGFEYLQLALSPDGNLLAATDGRGMLWLIDLYSGKKRALHGAVPDSGPKIKLRPSAGA